MRTNVRNVGRVWVGGEGGKGTSRNQSLVILKLKMVKSMQASATVARSGVGQGHAAPLV